MVNYNGGLVPIDSKLFTHKNRAFRFGDALFEEIRVVNGQIIFWEDHYFRLMASMRILRMEIPMEFTMEYLEEQVLTTIGSNELNKGSAIVRINIFRTEGLAITPESNSVDYMIEIGELISPFYVLEPRDYEVGLFKDYFVNPDMLSNLCTNNRILKTVASVYARENGYADCILLNTAKNVVETISGTLFLVSGDVVRTSKLSDGASNMVLRKKVIDIIRSIDGLEVEESSISAFQLQKTDELFVVNTEKGIVPVTKYRKKVYEQEVAKDLLGKLNASARLANLK